MATASLTDPTAVAGGTAWTVGTYPFDEASFSGPSGRSWSAFRVVDDGAEYEWRTGADRVRACAEGVARGALTVAEALQDPAVQRWLAVSSAELVPLLFEKDPSARTLGGDALNRRLFAEFAEDVSNTEGAFGYYMPEDDAYLRDAAEALDLPPWARVWLHGEGGPGSGSGFTAAAVVLEDGRTLHDLAEWLGALE